METAIIKIEERDGAQVVNARELHQFLEISKPFASWIKMQIERCDLMENTDYQALTQKVENPNGVGCSHRIEYALTIDAAKEVAMMSQTEKGRQARRYFIECEKKLKEQRKPMSATEMFYQSALALREQEMRLSNVELRLDAIDKEREENTKLLLSVEVSNNAVPEIKMRDKVRQLVNRYAKATNTKQQEVWHKIYNTLYYSYGISINAYKEKSKSKLDIAEKHGFLGKIYDIISNIVREKNIA